MRILHTSDWHLGRSFHGSSLHTYHEQYIAELVDYCQREQVDILLVAGDVYDSSTPSIQTVELLSQALTRLRAAGAHIVLSAGNHDSAKRLGYLSELLSAAGVHLRTEHTQAWEPVILSAGEQSVAIYAIPYLSPRYVASQLNVVGTHEAVLYEVMERVRANIAQRAERGDKAPSIVLSHATVSASGHFDPADRSDSEQAITIGGVDMVPASVFEGADYVALGHIHKRYAVTDTIRYSGSPIAFSFSEESYSHGGYLIDCEDGQLNVQDVLWETRMPLKTLTGALEDLLSNPEYTEYESGYFCRLIVRQEERPAHAYDRLRERFEQISDFRFESTLAPAPRSVQARSRVENTDPMDMCEEFMEHMRSRRLAPEEKEILNDILDSVLHAEPAETRKEA
ncbi:MAG: exonuclease subunit SbcD [Rothia sp. (in: high G+C Gram-positive bacteria)]|uniref:metallophosphoesterase family protein n=1 Tax=Rothia sp. (in: high G+C Gram-positive bacteria) TaxID=1885016 RepID=UPI0026E0822A|nr:exonuclease SbcCD subunit D C-terminal domain-containing protein [Rothia sp. (in: high G+C Gram-positive bacteria)]MDO5750178.1 exonuclease subunit SbcD [Rothia sp. (in: high G+C Gram-positive bacteria)]